MKNVFYLLLAIIFFSSGKCIANDIVINNDLVLTLKIDQVELDAGRVVVISKLLNNSESTITLLPWNTPFDSQVNGKIFNVLLINTEFDGHEIDYQGRMMKRQAPTQSDFIDLVRKQIIEQSLDITNYYKFCANKRYGLSFNTEFLATGSLPIPFIELASSEPSEFATNINFNNCVQ